MSPSASWWPWRSLNGSSRVGRVSGASWPLLSCLPFLGLDKAVMHSLGHGFDVVDVPEQFRITVVRYLVVGDRTVGCRVLADAQFTRSLACVEITGKDLSPQFLPSLALVPGADGCIGGVAGIPDLSGGPDALAHWLEPGLQCLDHLALRLLGGFSDAGLSDVRI